MTKKEVTAIRLIGTQKRTSNSYGKNLPYMSYRVLVSNDADSVRAFRTIQEAFIKEELKTLPYWSSRSEAMAMTCWGTSQFFEAQISLGKWLGINKKGAWSKFTQKCAKMVQEL